MDTDEEIRVRQEQIQIGPNEKLRITHSPTILIQTDDSQYDMEPDIAMLLQTWGDKDYNVIEVGVSQPYDSLLQKDRKWIIEQKCEIVILLAFNEKSHYSAPIWPCYPKFCTLEFLGHIWFGEHFESFIEVVRILAELIPNLSHNSGNLIVDFFDAVDFMDIIRCTMIETAVKRFQRAVKLRS
ncbi:hypothetical protein V1508DRAFT_405772 [Lipomyces doorenjongii]|uniref:uncharacterized protein n=1 Tax=Lipomyces doorenjongii TaxID=383834 RepID=UPI0034CE4FF4